MKSKKISILLAGVITASIILNPYASTVKNVYATTTTAASKAEDSGKQNSNEFKAASMAKAEANSVYLSSLDYDTKLSSTGHGKIMNNKTINGSKIRLKIDGEVVTFDKGMGAHATSELVYDISKHSNVYTRLSAYLGVDYSQSGKGNGVKFKIYTSDDASDWKLIKETGVLTASGNSHYVDLNVANAKYIKLQADMNGSNGNDHSVYGDLRLIKTDYDINSELYQEVQPLSYYDNILSKETVEHNYKNNLHLVLKREFVNRVGYRTIQSAVKDNNDVKEALDWLLKDKEDLELFIEAGSLFNGSGANTLKALGSLYKEYKNILSDKGDGYIYKKMLIATAVAYCKTIRTYVVDYGGAFVASDPVKKFKEFKDLYDNNKFLRKDEFKTYNMELVRYVMDAKMDDEEIDWLRSYSEYRFPKDTAKRLNSYSYLRYVNTGYASPDLYSDENKQKWDDKYKLTEYGINSYGAAKRYKIWMLIEKGAICWGISGMGTNLNEVHGIPAVNMYQPGHEAYLLYSQDAKGNGLWNIWNNVGNWSNSFSRWGNSTQSEARILLGWGCKSYNSFNKNNGSYILLAQGALNDYENYKKSLYYNLIANSYKIGSAEREEAYNKALEVLDINLDSYDGLIDSYKAAGNKTSKEWTNLAKRIIEAYTYYPLPMVEAINRITPHITDELDLVEINTLKTNALYSAKNATAAQSLQPAACKIVANSLLGKNTVALASFSFDGEHANQIRLNEDYDNVNLMVKYSLDGGTNWKQSENHTIQLTDEEVKSITAEKDIKVGLVGSNTTYTIDIQNGKTVSNVYVNDAENLLIGNVNNLQYSTDGGTTWKDYVGGIKSEIRFTGNQVVKFRNKAHGTYLQGKEAQFTFKEDVNTAEQSYLQLRNVSLHEYSSQNSTNSNHAAVNFIDGNANTGWHTLFNGSDTSKFYSVKFDKVRFISKLTYLPSNSANGRLKSGEIYTSMDGKTWEKVHSFTNLANSKNLQTINLPSSVQANYLKIVATETWGNNTQQYNKFFSGKMLNFYEDTTKTYLAEAIVEYSTKEITNKSVTATLKVPTGGTAKETEFTFKENGTHTFTYTDSKGVEQSIKAEVNWIDTKAPDVKVEYDVVNPTNGNVIAKLVGLAEGEEVVNNEKSSSYTFTKNGSFEFVVRDKAGNETKVVAEVNWIDTEAPDIKVEYDVKEATNGKVTAKLVGLGEGEEVVNNEKSSTYIFTENGSFEFIVKDKVGNETKVVAKVNWIDTEAPDVKVEYDVKEATNGKVTAKLVGLGEGEEVVNNEKNTTYTFDKNGSFEFIVKDKAGNESKVVAEVNWIDTEAPNVKVEYDVTDKTNGKVTAKLVGLGEGEEVVNNEKNTTYTFADNGSFEFIVKDKAGNEAKVVAEVNWIVKEDPITKVTYSTLENTNQDVTVSIGALLEEGSIIKNNGGNATYTFTENGKFEFIIVDKLGNETTVPVEVNSIDKTPPMVLFNYSTIDNTNEPVTVTIDGLQDDEFVVNNGGSTSYTFTENGSFEFVVRDKAGNETKSVAVVDWIEKAENTEEATTNVNSGSTVEHATNEGTNASSNNTTSNNTVSSSNESGSNSGNNSDSNTSESNNANKTDSKKEDITKDSTSDSVEEDNSTNSVSEEDSNDASAEETSTGNPATIAMVVAAITSVAAGIFVAIKKFFK